MSRRMMHETSQRISNINGKAYKFNRYASQGYVEVWAYRWTGWEWKLIHHISFTDGK